MWHQKASLDDDRGQNISIRLIFLTIENLHDSKYYKINYNAIRKANLRYLL